MNQESFTFPSLRADTNLTNEFSIIKSKHRKIHIQHSPIHSPIYSPIHSPHITSSSDSEDIQKQLSMETPRLVLDPKKNSPIKSVFKKKSQSPRCHVPLKRSQEHVNVIEDIWNNMDEDQKIITLIHNTNTQGKSLLIHAVYEGDIELVKKIMLYETADLNIQDSYGNTALHYAVLWKQYNIAWIFLYDLRINSLIRNNQGHFAQNLCKRESELDTHLHNGLFARWAIENEIKSCYILFEYPSVDDYLSDDIIIHIKKKAIGNGDIILSSFITDEFIRNMVKAWIPHCKSTHSNFIGNELYFKNALRQDEKDSKCILEELRKKSHRVNKLEKNPNTL